MSLNYMESVQRNDYFFVRKLTPQPKLKQVKSLVNEVSGLKTQRQENSKMSRVFSRFTPKVYNKNDDKYLKVILPPRKMDFSSSQDLSPFINRKSKVELKTSDISSYGKSSVKQAKNPQKVARNPKLLVSNGLKLKAQSPTLPNLVNLAEKNEVNYHKRSKPSIQTLPKTRKTILISSEARQGKPAINNRIKESPPLVSKNAKKVPAVVKKVAPTVVKKGGPAVVKKAPPVAVKKVTQAVKTVPASNAKPLPVKPTNILRLTSQRGARQWTPQTVSKKNVHDSKTFKKPIVPQPKILAQINADGTIEMKNIKALIRPTNGRVLHKNLITPAKLGDGKKTH